MKAFTALVSIVVLISATLAGCSNDQTDAQSQQQSQQQPQLQLEGQPIEPAVEEIKAVTNTEQTVNEAPLAVEKVVSPAMKDAATVKSDTAEEAHGEAAPTATDEGPANEEPKAEPQAE